MRLSKFSLCNRLSVAELGELLCKNGREVPGASVDMCHRGPWNMQALASNLEISDEQVQAGFCSYTPPKFRSLADTRLRYCEPCLAEGFHAAWFQWSHIERCPLHDMKLRTGCPRCRASIPFTLGRGLASNPLQCSACRSFWTPSLFGPAGRCTPITPRAGALLKRWSDYVGDIVAFDCQLQRGHREGSAALDVQSTSQALQERPHVLTMSNRFFDSPPPRISQLAPRFEGRPRPARPHPSALATVTDREQTDWRRIRWPHFGNDFTKHERLVRTEQIRAFGQRRQEVCLGRRRQILLDGLVTPTDSVHRHAAAALGWSVSWFGASQTLAAPDRFSAPAFGLTAWLSRLPVRPNALPAWAWHERVSHWLAEDLALSAKLWSHVAAFMSTGQFYLLYGELVSPMALAVRHAVPAQ